VKRRPRLHHFSNLRLFYSTMRGGEKKAGFAVLHWVFFFKKLEFLGTKARNAGKPATRTQPTPPPPPAAPKNFLASPTPQGPSFARYKNAPSGGFIQRVILPGSGSRAAAPIAADTGPYYSIRHRNVPFQAAGPRRSPPGTRAAAHQKAPTASTPYRYKWAKSERELGPRQQGEGWKIRKLALVYS